MGSGEWGGGGLTPEPRDAVGEWVRRPWPHVLSVSGGFHESSCHDLSGRTRRTSFRAPCVRRTDPGVGAIQPRRTHPETNRLNAPLPCSGTSVIVEPTEQSFTRIFYVGTAKSGPKGCSFLINEVGVEDIQTPEKFTEDQQMFAKTAEDFMEKEVFPYVDTWRTRTSTRWSRS